MITIYEVEVTTRDDNEPDSVDAVAVELALRDEFNDKDVERVRVLSFKRQPKEDSHE